MRRLPSRRGAFTLVEALVVIAIIALLALVAFPAVEGTIKKGHDARCASNLKTLSTAVLAYCADNNGLFPNPRRPVDGSVEQYWHRQISTYLGATNFNAFSDRSKMDNVFLCPSDPDPYNGKLSYGLNLQLMQKKMTHVTRTSAIMISDSSVPFSSPPRIKTNHGEHVHFVRLDGSFARVTNAGTLDDSPELWKISY
jgi:prepilin-type N-terminal cleavage/methylation domain-containing protein